MRLDSLKQSSAARRKAHFSAGGTPQTWRGSPKTLDQARSKARRMKEACRNWKEEQ